MTSNASSSLTAPTVQLQGQGNWAQPPNVPNPYGIPDTGQLMNIQQFTQLMKMMERQTKSAMSSHINTILAFHDPDRGIKQLITEEIRRAVKIEMALNREPRSPRHSRINLPRVRSHNDILQLAAHQPSRVIARNETTTCNVEELLSLEYTSNIANTKSDDKPTKIAGSFVSTFNPPPVTKVQATSDYQSQNSCDLLMTPINEIAHPKTPGIYHGPIRAMGDEIMKALDGELKKTEDTNEGENENEIANATDTAVASTSDASSDQEDHHSIHQAKKTPPRTNFRVVLGLTPNPMNKLKISLKLPPVTQ
jgi:hypothetical protein